MPGNVRFRVVHIMGGKSVSKKCRDFVGLQREDRMKVAGLPSLRENLMIFVVIGLVLDAGLAHGGNTEFLRLLDALRGNSAITQQQYDQLKEEVEGSDQNEQEKGEEDDVRVSTKGGIEVDSYDGGFSFELGGRLMIDAAYYAEDRNPLGSGTELRRARLEAEGVLFEDWGYEFGVDFAGGGADVKDAYIQYEGDWPMRLTVGQFKEPFSLEELTSSKYITFMERALPNEFAPGRNIGVGLHARGEHWTAAAGAFGEAFDADPADEGDEGWGVTGRLTYARDESDARVFHSGASISYRRPDEGKSVSFNARPESHVTDLKFVDTGSVNEVGHLAKYGVELAAVFDRFSVQSEYIRTDVERDAGLADVTFDGWYAYGSWFLMGEARQYKRKKGVFGPVNPKGRYGAWELAVRYSAIDLTDGAIVGGRENNLTFGLNWYANPRVRIMADYVIVDNDGNADADGGVSGDDDLNLFQARFQIHF